MSDPIRIGFVGVGQIGKHHLSSYAKIPDAKVVALCDINEGRAWSVANEASLESVILSP
jgi:predicted dehydrogenase